MKTIQLTTLLRNHKIIINEIQEGNEIVLLLANGQPSLGLVPLKLLDMPVAIKTIKNRITGNQLNELGDNAREILWLWYEKQEWYPVSKENSTLLSLSPSNKGRWYPLLTIDQMRKFLNDRDIQKRNDLTKGQWIWNEGQIIDVFKEERWCDEFWKKILEEINA
ncbi:hypothetical protein HY025_03175 [Candidatus Daviesbacteria bacterium]|nr:hypothetical protein [Candidatus Daviesbacteria bacterium]